MIHTKWLLESWVFFAPVVFAAKSGIIGQGFIGSGTFQPFRFTSDFVGERVVVVQKVQ